ncbi:MAG: hypothetical protein KTR25_13805 [Myxococcales bacterium]|nr:hypothetical protein [Myxococcales bacterium]
MRLELQHLMDVAVTLEQRIREGLAADGREIKALPAYLSPPPDDLRGDAWVVDAGGTNVRAAYVRIGPEGDVVVAGPNSERLPVRGESETDEPMQAQAFWNMQAELVAKCLSTLDTPSENAPLGYCFSYPSTVHENRDATLITWTKGVAIDNVEGHTVGRPLCQALQPRGVSPAQTVVLNDTVAALLGGASFATHSERVIGLIAGTGTNMATYFRPSTAPKLHSNDNQPMAINLESGNFVPPFLTPVDDAFDASGDKPGQQRFEKAVSGYALPYLFAQLVPELGFDPQEGSGPLGHYKTTGTGRAQAAAEVLLDRSADLMAAALLGVARTLGGREPVTVLAEGSLIWKAPGYADRVRRQLAALCPNGPTISIARRPDVNLFGSAVAARSLVA